MLRIPPSACISRPTPSNESHRKSSGSLASVSTKYWSEFMYKVPRTRSSIWARCPNLKRPRTRLCSMGALPYQRYIRTVGLSILLHALPVLHGQPKEVYGAADEDPWSEGLLNACENPLGIVGMVRGLLEEVAHRLLREAGRKI